jgi:heterotetrameric sarcosine oxidase delta subunit
MLLIACPWCGPRDEDEFLNGGEAEVARPVGEVGDEAWADYLFFHDNPKGPLRERWVHAYGCRQWFHALRDTGDHRIFATWRLNQAPPEPGP